MSDSHGRFVWYELMTTDRKAATDFYTKIVGWKTQDAEMPGMTYTMLIAGEAPVAGLVQMPDLPPCWRGFVGVDDVDASTEKAKRLGAAVQFPPTDIPNVGRFSALSDPQGATIMLFKGNAEAPSAAGASGAGTIAWHELYCSDYKEELDFYSQLFGWEKGEAMEMGEMGTYQIFNRGGQMLGGMMNKPPQVPVNFWQYYIAVDEIGAAAKRIADNRGTVLMGPMQVPGGDWVVQGRDPQGVVFALFSNKKS